MNFETAAYCARYIMKKVNGDMSDEHYSAVLESTGEVVQRAPEFCHMSLKPGIGRGWLDKFSSDVYPHGMVVSNSVESRPPSYYDRWFKANYPEQWEAMAWSRVQYAAERSADATPERLAVREAVTLARISQLKRSL